MEALSSRLNAEESGGTRAVFVRARLHLARKEFTPARELLEGAIAQGRQETLLWVLLSHVLLQEGKDWDAAERALQKILEINPEDAEARSNLRVLLRQQGRGGAA